MKTIEINGTELRIKDYYCCPCRSDFEPKEGADHIALDDPRLWLYVNVTNECNAACPFCVNEKKDMRTCIDPDKYRRALQIAAPFISGVSFTGGEPMLDPASLGELIRIADEVIDRDAEFDMVTNGTNLGMLSKISELDRLSTIHISRHAIDDAENRRMMRWHGAPGWENIKDTVAKLTDPGSIVLNCVMQKGGVQDMDDVCAYLDKAIEAGIRNTSFITMMPANRYCVDNYISPETFAVISDEQIGRFNETHESKISIWNRMRDHDYCRCLSGSYESVNGRTRFYFRCPRESRPSEYCRQLVYTPDNNLQDGFGLNRTIII